MTAPNSHVLLRVDNNPAVHGVGHAECREGSHHDGSKRDPSHSFRVTNERVVRSLCVFFSLLIYLATRTTPATGCVSDGRYVMGTVLEVTLCDIDPAQSQPLLNALFTTATRLDSLFTTFSPDSPISRLNLRAGQGSQLVPPAVTEILSLSLHYWQLTEGAFDVTVGPLMALWRQAAAKRTRPAPASVQQVRRRVGSEKITLSPNGLVSLAHRGMAIDLGGIGKGFALDQIADLLRAEGAAHALLDFGQSSQWALGTPPDAAGWRLLVRQPDGKIVGMITLRDQALSVSGSLGQSVMVNGHRHGHVIDPRTGKPLQRDLLSCVVAPSAAQAEALSTALLILGEHEGIALLERLPGVAGLLVEASGRRWMTTNWVQAVAFQNPPQLGLPTTKSR